MVNWEKEEELSYFSEILFCQCLQYVTQNQIKERSVQIVGHIRISVLQFLAVNAIQKEVVVICSKIITKIYHCKKSRGNEMITHVQNLTNSSILLLLKFEGRIVAIARNKNKK